MAHVPYVNFTDIGNSDSPQPSNGQVQIQTTPDQRKRPISINGMRTSTIILGSGLILVAIFAIANFALVLQVKNSEQQKFPPKIVNLIIKAENWYEASNGKMYKVFEHLLPFIDAVHFCENLGGRLASTGIRDPKLKREIISGLNLRDTLFTWIGLHDILAEGQWTWLDNVITHIDEIDWIAGQPSNFTQFVSLNFNADCVLMSVLNEGKFADEACFFRHHFMCEI